MFDVKGKQALSLTAWFRLGFPEVQYQEIEQDLQAQINAAQDLLGFPGKPQGHPGAQASSRIAPTSAQGFGESGSSARAPLALMQIRVHAGTDFMNTE